MTFTKILCPIDFSAGSQQALRVATRIAVAAGAELVVAHAWYVPPPAMSGEFVVPGYIIQDMVDEAQRGLDAAVRDAGTAGAKRVNGKLVSGPPWMEINALLERQGFDLCVMGTSGRTGIARVLLGSVAEKIVRHAHCSVLAVRRDSEVKPFRHLLVPTDFSETARHALEQAADIVQPDGAVALLHVIDSPTLYAGPEPLSDYGRQLAQHADVALADAIRRLERKPTATITTRIRFGSAGAQTLAALDEDRTVDLVVMGSHGRTGFKRAFLGSVAEKVVRHAHCPVLVARTRG